MPQPEVDMEMLSSRYSLPPYSFGKRKKLITPIGAVESLGIWKAFLFLFLWSRVWEWKDKVISSLNKIIGIKHLFYLERSLLLEVFG